VLVLLVLLTIAPIAPAEVGTPTINDLVKESPTILIVRAMRDVPFATPIRGHLTEFRVLHNVRGPCPLESLMAVSGLGVCEVPPPAPGQYALAFFEPFSWRQTSVYHIATVGVDMMGGDGHRNIVRFPHVLRRAKTDIEAKSAGLPLFFIAHGNRGCLTFGRRGDELWLTCPDFYIRGGGGPGPDLAPLDRRRFAISLRALERYIAGRRDLAYRSPPRSALQALRSNVPEVD